jgi:hypothetical protein
VVVPVSTMHPPMTSDNGIPFAISRIRFCVPVLRHEVFVKSAKSGTGVCWGCPTVQTLFRAHDTAAVQVGSSGNGIVGKIASPRTRWEYEKGNIRVRIRPDAPFAPQDE